MTDKWNAKKTLTTVLISIITLLTLGVINNEIRNVAAHTDMREAEAKGKAEILEIVSDIRVNVSAIGARMGVEMKR